MSGRTFDFGRVPTSKSYASCPLRKIHGPALTAKARLLALPARRSTALTVAPMPGGAGSPGCLCELDDGPRFPTPCGEGGRHGRSRQCSPVQQETARIADPASCPCAWEFLDVNLAEVTPPSYVPTVSRRIRRLRRGT